MRLILRLPQVMGLYATLFPEHVNLMVLDGNDDPNSDLLLNVEDVARSLNDRIDYAIYSCYAADHANPGFCPVERDVHQQSTLRR